MLPEPNIDVYNRCNLTAKAWFALAVKARASLTKLTLHTKACWQILDAKPRYGMGAYRPTIGLLGSFRRPKYWRHFRCVMRAPPEKRRKHMTAADPLV